MEKIKQELKIMPHGKHHGSVYTKNKKSDGSIWVATFNIPPMAANAQIESKLQITHGNHYKLLEETKVEIPISYGAILKNLSEYVTKEDIKNIQAELVIDGNRVKLTNDKETLEITDNYILHVNKEKYGDGKAIEIVVRCNVIAETYFNDDRPLYDSKEEIIVIQLKEEENIVEVDNVNRRFESGDKPKISSIEIKRVSTDARGNEKYVDLNVVKKTGKEFICAGQVIYIRVKTLNDTAKVTLEIEGDASITTLDELTKRFEYTQPKERNIKTRYKTLSALKKSYEMPLKLKLEEDAGGGVKYFSAIYVVPYGTKQTLNSWANIREENKNAFEIDESKIFERIREPYEIVIKARSEIGITTKRTKLDVFEAWNTIYNRDLSQYVK